LEPGSNWPNWLTTNTKVNPPLAPKYCPYPIVVFLFEGGEYHIVRSLHFSQYSQLIVENILGV
jgi:hypothetical protein